MKKRNISEGRKEGNILFNDAGMSLNIQQRILFTVLWASDAFSLHALGFFLDEVKKEEFS